MCGLLFDSSHLMPKCHYCIYSIFQHIVKSQAFTITAKSKDGFHPMTYFIEMFFALSITVPIPKCHHGKSTQCFLGDKYIFIQLIYFQTIWKIMRPS